MWFPRPSYILKTVARRLMKRSGAEVFQKFVFPLCHLAALGVVFRTCHLVLTPAYTHDISLDLVMDLYWVPACYDLATCDLEHYVPHVHSDNIIEREYVPYYVGSQLKEMSDSSVPYRVKPRAFVGPITILLYRDAKVVKSYSLTFETSQFDTKLKFLRTAEKIIEVIGTLDEVRLVCMVHSLATNTFSQLQAVYKKRINNMWHFTTWALTGRVTSYFIVVDEDSVRESAGLSHSIFTNEDVPEVCALTLVLLVLYLLLAVLETPHIGLCSFRLTSPLKSVFVSNLLLAVTQGMVVRCMLQQGWQLRAAIDRHSGNLFYLHEDIRQHIVKHQTINYLYAIEVWLLLFKSIAMPSFLKDTLSLLLRSLRLALQKLWQVVALTVLAMLAMSTVLYAMANLDILHTLTVDEAFFTLLQGNDRERILANRLFFPFELITALLLVPFLIANVTDIALDEIPEHQFDSDESLDSDFESEEDSE